MKRRSFLQAVCGSIAAVFAPLAVAEKHNRRPELERLAAAFRETRGIQERAWLNNDSRVPPETVTELRTEIEARYETVHEFDAAPYKGVIGRAPTAQPIGYGGPFYAGFVITGQGATEKEAVADAFKNIKWDVIGGKEMMWRIAPNLTRWKDFAADISWVEIRGRLLVLR